MGRTSDARTRLLQTAIALMHARGALAVSVQEICTHASIKKGSFYHFFPSKQALILAVIEAYGARVRTVWQEALSTNGSLDERLQRAFVRACEVCMPASARAEQWYGCPLGNLALELSSHDDVIRQKLQETFAGWVQVIECTLRQAVARGELPPLDTRATAQSLLAYFEGVMLLAKTHNDPAVATRLARGALWLIHAATQPATPLPSAERRSVW